MKAAGPLLVLALTIAIAADKKVPAWPEYRGPGGSGIADDTDNPPIEFGPAKHLLWKTVVPSGHASPSIWGDRIFLTTFDKPTKMLEVMALARGSGKLVWRRAVPAEGLESVHDISSPATATPATDGERVYAYFGSYGLICFDRDGYLLWSVPLGVANVIPYGSGTSPILAGELVILNRDEGPEPYILAVDRHTGKTVWKQEQYMGDPKKRGGSKATPVVWKDYVILHRRNEVVGFDLKTGLRKWWVTANTQGAGTPVAGPDAIYVGEWFTGGEPDLRVPMPDFDALLAKYDKDGDGVLSAGEFPEKILRDHRLGLDGLPGADGTVSGKNTFRSADKNQDGKIDRAEWDEFLKGYTAPSEEHGLTAIRPGGEGDVTSTRVLWKESRGVPEVPAPLYYKGRVYTVTYGGVVSCLDALSGKVIFRQRLGASGAYFSSPVAAGGRIYFASEEGIVSVISDGDKLEVLARNDLGEPVFATPAIVESVLYIRTPAHVFAFGN
jgi:outer membrane protein assembly factor BamB